MELTLYDLYQKMLTEMVPTNRWPAPTKEQVLVEAVLIIKRAQISDFNQGVKPAKLSYLF